MVALSTRKRITRSSTTSVPQQNSTHLISNPAHTDSNNKNRTKKSTKKNIPSKINKIIDEDSKNHDVCDACNRVGNLLCCESCPSAFHFACLNPPINAIDAKNWDAWYCTECLYKRKRKKHLNRKMNEGIALFDCLFNELEKNNPVAFCLPEYIRNYFEGVSTGRNGVYIDATNVKAAKLKNGHYEKQDYFQLKDHHGNYLFCYRCRKSAYKKPMVACDFCKLHWHFDCLDPPMTIPPHPTKKWMCPCHAEHAEKLYQRIPRKPRADPNISYSTPIISSPSTSTNTTNTAISSPSTNISTETSDTFQFSLSSSGFHNQNSNNTHQISNSYKNNKIHTKDAFLHKSRHQSLSNDFKLNFIDTSNNNN
ncbi:unnamed protein product [Cunninghamella blakesleeana]